MDAILIDEWIGRRARVAGAKNPNHIGLSGVVIDETHSTLVLRGPDGRRRRVPKAGTSLDFGAGTPPADLAPARMRPQDRMKKLYKKMQG